MNNNLKKIVFICLVGLIAYFANIVLVNADTAKDSIVVNTIEKGKGNNPLGVDRTFAVKKDSNGNYMYCMDYHMLSPVNTTYKKQGKTSDKGVAYIMTLASDDSNDDEFFVTQMALWIYLLDKNLMQDSSIGSIKVYREAVYNKSNDNNKVALEIRDIVAKAKSAKASNNASLSVSGDTSFTLKDNYYKSSLIKVNTTASDYEVKLENAPSGAKVEKSSNGFVVTIPSSSIENGGTNFKAIVTADQTNVEAYVYNDPNGVYQPVVGPYTKEEKMQDEITLVVQTNVVSIIKKDKDTNQALEGATLQLLDKNGNIIDEWKSTNESHLIYGLEKGSYTIKEITAPNGYKKSDDLTFKVTSDTGVKTINFYNEKEQQEIIPEKGNPETKPEQEEVINVEVESTGMNKSVLLSVIGMLAVISGITMIYRKTRESNK